MSFVIVKGIVRGIQLGSNCITLEGVVALWCIIYLCCWFLLNKRRRGRTKDFSYGLGRMHNQTGSHISRYHWRQNSLVNSFVFYSPPRTVNICPFKTWRQPWNVVRSWGKLTELTFRHSCSWWRTMLTLLSWWVIHTHTHQDEEYCGYLEKIRTHIHVSCHTDRRKHLWAC